MAAAVETVHATALAYGGAGVIIRGASGAGKSDLALRCLGLAPSRLLPLPVVLVADDRVELRPAGDSILMSCPAAIAGLIEVRGLGIIAAGAMEKPVRLVLVADLANSRDRVERLPEPACAEILGIAVPRFALYPFESSAPLKLLLAVKMAAQGQLADT